MRKLLIVIISLVALTGLAHASTETWYLRADGDDALCDGLTNAAAASAPNCAYKTATPIAAKSCGAGAGELDGGDTISLNKGSSYGDYYYGIYIGCSGAEGSPITITSHGTGALPIISGATPQTGVYINAKNYITIQNIQVQLTTGAAAIHCQGACNNIVVSGTTLIGATGIGHGVNTGTNSSGWTIQNNTIYGFDGNGVSASGLDASTISTNTIHSNCNVPGSWAYCGGIRVTGNAGDGSDTNSVIIELNEIYNHLVPSILGGIAISPAAIWLDFLGTGSIVRRNTVYNNIWGIMNEVTSGSKIYYNVGYGNGIGIFIFGRVKTGSDNVASSNLIYNNTFTGCTDVACIVVQGAGEEIEATCQANQVKNNIAIGVPGTTSCPTGLTVCGGSFRMGGHAQLETDGNKNIVSNNSFGTEVALWNQFEWGWGTYKQTYDAFETAYGGTTNSVETSPSFVSTTTPNYHLASPVGVNAGTDVCATLTTATDRAGNAVCSGGVFVGQGGAPEIGAYESITGYVTPNAGAAVTLNAGPAVTLY